MQYFLYVFELWITIETMLFLKDLIRNLSWNIEQLYMYVIDIGEALFNLGYTK